MTDQRNKKAAFNWGFSTLGCAELTLEQVSELAAKYKIPNIELRTLNKRLDLAKYLSEVNPTAESVAKFLGPRKQRISCLDSSFRLMDAKPADRDDLLGYAHWAHILNVPYIRIFPRGGSGEGTPLTDQNFAQAAENVRWWKEEKKKRGWKVELLLETHDALCRPEPMQKLQKMLDEPLLMLWDAYNSWVLGIPIQETWDAFRKEIRYLHFKDSVVDSSEKNGHRYVTPGTGDFPTLELFSILSENKFSGVVSLEWEQWWHPTLPSLEETLREMQKQSWWVEPAMV